MAEEEKKVEVKDIVVKELPVVQTRQASDDKTDYNCLTVEEALTEILTNVREIKKKLD